MSNFEHSERGVCPERVLDQFLLDFFAIFVFLEKVDPSKTMIFTVRI